MADTALIRATTGPRTQRRHAMKTWAREIGQALFLPLGGILFIGSPLVGAGLWLVLFLTPVLAVSAVFALGLIALMDLAIVRRTGAPLSPEYRTNGLLAALFAGWVFSAMGLPLPATGAIVALATLLATFIVRLALPLLHRLGLPVLVWPFCVVAAMIVTLFPEGASVAAAHFDWPLMPNVGLAGLPAVFGASQGTFLFTPTAAAGLLIVALVALWSPVLALAAVIGWVSGAALSVGLVTLGALVAWVPTSYNFFLAGMSLGAVYFRPGLRGLAIAAAAGAAAALIAAVLQIGTNYSGVSYFPVAFMLTLYAGILAGRGRGTARWNGFPPPPGLRPELACIAADGLRARWGDDPDAQIGLPVRGAVEITQGVDGVLTHRGAWRYAIDLQRPRDLVGTENEYRPTIWESEVFAPVNGTVVSVRQDVHDNPLGVVNAAENWGNRVLIRTGTGHHVALCHLRTGSVRVSPGQPVDYATPLGLVGNSGLSAVPHLHVHMQAAPDIGAATRPFRLANVFELDPVDQSCRLWHASVAPVEGWIVAPALPNPVVHTLLAGLLPGRAIWVAGQDAPTGRTGGKPAGGHVRLTTSQTETGSLRVASETGETFELRQDLDALRVIAVDARPDGFVASLAIAMSTIPYAAFPGLEWEDTLPVARAGLVPTPRELAAPFLGAPLTRIRHRCEAVPDPTAGRLVIGTEARVPGQREPVRSRLVLAERQGAVHLSVGEDGERASRELVSFELAAT